MITRYDLVTPIVLAFIFTAVGEILILVVWGTMLSPGGSLVQKLVWAILCGTFVGATIGAFVLLFVVGRLQGLPAAALTWFIFAAVVTICTALCFILDLKFNLFGAHVSPNLFLWGGFATAVVSGSLYAWLVCLESGQRLVRRFSSVVAG